MIDPEQPARAPSDFFGQKNLLRRIFSRIGTERPQSVAVIGGSKTGKTSLLNCLGNEEVRSRYLEQPQRYLFYRIDSQDALFKDWQSFISAVIRLLGSETLPGRNPYNALQKTVESFHARAVHLIFLLDDFHLITGNKLFPLEFFSFLRSLANNYNLAYVTTSFLELQKLCVIKDIEESPFFNIFTNLSLGPLSLDEATELFCSLTGRSAGEVRSLVQWCGCFPYLLKLAARELAEGRTDALAADPEKTLLPVLSPYFERILSILPAQALEPLKGIARGKAPDPRTAYHLRPLVKQGFLTEEPESLSAFSPAFLAFLKRSLSRKMLQGRT